MASVQFLPLNTASKVAFIDDDPPYLDALQMVIPEQMLATYHTDPDTLGPLLDKNREKLHAERELLLRLDARNGIASPSAVVAALQYLASPVRHDVIAVLIADFSMPKENGVNLCRRFRMPGMQRLLLTGMADQAMAISAFNIGAIEQYVPKQAPHLLDELVEQIYDQIKASCERRGEMLLEQLQPELRAQLAQRPVATALTELLAQHDVVEWVLIAQPQGLVCLRSDGGVLWMQLESEASSKELAEGLDAEGWTAEAIDSVLSGLTIVDLDFSAQLERPARSLPAIELRAKPRLSVAVFEVKDLPAGLVPVSRPVAGMP
jgi:DNA-binding NarL/FixJ family response regulator